MRNINANTQRKKSPKDRASEVMIATGFYKKVETALNEFGLNLVKADKAIGTSGHEEDWPVRHRITHPSSGGVGGNKNNYGSWAKGPFWWYIDSPCWDDSRVTTDGCDAHIHWMMANGDGEKLNATYLEGMTGTGKEEGIGHRFLGNDQRDQNVPVSMWMEKAGSYESDLLKVEVRNSYGNKVTERVAIDDTGAKDLAKVMCKEQCSRVRDWLTRRKQARKVLLNELSRREALGEYGQGGHWFVQRSDPSNHSRDCYSILNGNEILRGGILNCGNEDSYMELYRQPLEMVKRLHAALRIPEKLAKIENRHLDINGYRKQQDEAKCKWMVGYHANQWSINNDLVVEDAHRMMNSGPPAVPEIPRRFRTLRKELLMNLEKEDGTYEEFQMAALVSEEETLPWKPLDPQTISGLQHPTK